MVNGAQIMVKCLEKEGVKVVFGYPGAAICPFYDELYQSEIHHILVRQEQNAGHAASGYARASGKPGVCIATSGPGATNLITGLATAYMDSIPIIAITGQVRSDLFRPDMFQEVDITGACEPFTKHSYLVKNTADLPRVFKEAFHIAATGRPGPVLIDIPIDIQQNETSEFHYPEKAEIIGYKPRSSGHPLQIKRAAAAPKGKQAAPDLFGRRRSFLWNQAETAGLCGKNRYPRGFHHDGNRRNALGASSVSRDAGLSRKGLRQ